MMSKTLIVAAALAVALSACNKKEEPASSTPATPTAPAPITPTTPSDAAPSTTPSSSSTAPSGGATTPAS